MVNKLAFLAFFWYFGLAIVKIDICTYIWLYGLKFSLKIGLFEKFYIQCWSKQMTQSPARARNPNTLLRFSRIFNVPSFSLQWIFPWFTNSKRRWSNSSFEQGQMISMIPQQFELFSNFLMNLVWPSNTLWVLNSVPSSECKMTSGCLFFR